MKADPGDRNRTSPFAFTGNRFEFRAPGSSQSISGPMVAINTIMAEALDYIATELEASLAAGMEFNDAVQKVLAQIITDHGAVVFNGNGYSDEWQEEAAARGLLNLRTTVDALPQLAEPAIVDVLAKYKVLSRRELASRLEVYLEQYILSVHVEAKETAEMARTTILPAAQRYLGELAGVAANLKAVDLPYDADHAEDHLGSGHRAAGRDRRTGGRAGPRGRATAVARPRRVRPGRADPADGQGPRGGRRAGGLWWPTTCGRCRPTRRCCTSSDEPLRRWSTAARSHSAGACASRSRRRRTLERFASRSACRQAKCSLRLARSVSHGRNIDATARKRDLRMFARYRGR